MATLEQDAVVQRVLANFGLREEPEANAVRAVLEDSRRLRGTQHEALMSAVRWVIREARAGRTIKPGSDVVNSLIVAFKDFGEKDDRS